MTDRLKLGLLLLLALWIRLFWSALPPFEELNYEESLVGLMARHILAGDFVAVWWGQPYGGTLEIYILSLFTLLFGESVTVMRLVPIIISCAGLLSIFYLGRTLFNTKIALRAVFFLAIAPVFLLRLSIVPYSGYLTTLALGPWIILWTYNVLFRKQRIDRIGWHYFGIGLFSGLLIWQHLVGASFFIASFLLLFVCQRRFLFNPGFYVLAIGFFIGLFPLIVWNLSHYFATFHSMIEGHGSGNLLLQLQEIFKVHLPSLFSPKHPWFKIPFLILYIPIVLFLFFRVLRTIKSLFQRDRGDWEGSRFLCVYFISSILLVALTDYHLARYLFSVYTTVPLLIVFFLSRIENKFPKLSISFFVLLISINALGSFLYAQSVRLEVRRPVDPVIELLKEKEIAHVVAHYRVAWPIQFESKEEIIASDFNSFRDNPYYMNGLPVYMEPFFDMAQSVLTADKVAYLTHDGLRLPSATLFESTLKALQAEFKKEKQGLYTLFYDVRPKVVSYKEVNLNKVNLSSSISEKRLSLLSDGNLSTAWSTKRAQRKGDTLTVKFQSPVALSKVVFDSGEFVMDTPNELYIETTRNGRDWVEAVDLKQGCLTADWIGNHLFFNLKGNLSIYFYEEKIEGVRFTIGGNSSRSWIVSELRLFEKDASKTVSLNEYEFDFSSVDSFYAEDEQLIALKDNDAAKGKISNLFERKFIPLEKQGKRVNFKNKNAFLIPENKIKYVEAFIKKNHLSLEPIKVNESYRLFVLEPHPWIASMIWSEGRLFDYDSRSEAFSLMQKGDEERDQKHLGVAREYYESSFRKARTSFAYFKLVDTLTHLNNQKALTQLKEEWEDSFVPEVARNEVFDKSIRLIGFSPPPAILKPGETVDAICLWKCLEPIKSDLTVFVHFEGPEGSFFQADHLPLMGQLRTDEWQKGEIIGDRFEITVPENIMPGRYEVYLGLWDPKETQERLKVFDQQGNKIGSRIKIGEIICETGL